MVLNKYKNPKIQGNVGIGAAIAYFTSVGAIVSIPLTDSQQYDLVVDFGGKLNRVQVKTSTYIAAKDKRYTVSLKTSGGNQSWNGRVKKFNIKLVEFLFILTGDGKMYNIPVGIIEGRSSISPACNKYKQHEVSI